MSYADYIEIDPSKRYGNPVIIGTRIAVYDVLNWFAEMTISEFLMRTTVPSICP